MASDWKIRPAAQAAMALLVALSCAGAASALARSGGESSAARPHVKKVVPRTIERFERMTISGSRFVRARRGNTVVFLGGRGKRDDVSVRTRALSSKRIRLRAPAAKVSARGRGAVSGPIKVVNRFGSSRPTTFKLVFDDDGDGLSNERERRLGTNPRKRDTDGDGVPDGRDPDPLHAPDVTPPTEPQPPGPEPDPATTCPTVAATGLGSGPASSFDGIGNVITEGRSRIAHSAHSDPAGVYCLYRKRRGEPDSAYQLVGSSPGAGGAATIQDGQRPFKTEDYLYRTDVTIPGGVAAGANTVGARGAGSVPNATGWAQIDQSCVACGSAAVQSGALRATVRGNGQNGPDVGEVAVWENRLSTGPDTEFVARALRPLPPATEGAHVSAAMTISATHPAAARNDAAGTVGDVTSAPGPWISVELRATRVAGGEELRVITWDSSSGQKFQSGDLLADGTVDNVYLVVDPLPGGLYEVRYKSNVTPGDVDQKIDFDPGAGVQTSRQLPAGLASGWLSLKAESSRNEDAEHDARFDSMDMIGQGASGRDEVFGGVSSSIQVPLGFEAEAVASDLLAPTAVAFAPSGAMYIAQKPGIVQRLDPGSQTPVQVLDIQGEVNSPLDVLADQGLTSIVLDPQFDVPGHRFIYLAYTVEAAEPACSKTRTVARVSRFTIQADGHADSEHVLVGGDDAVPIGPCSSEAEPPLAGTCPPSPSSDCLPSDAYTHSSGALAFGQDGRLWVSVPDGASPEGTNIGGSDPLALRAQNQDSLAGKVLRVDPATGDGVTDNPQFNAGDPDSPRSRTWARGFRNPFRLAQRPDGASWYVTDVGWGAWEEINRFSSTTGGGNFAWPCREGPDTTIYTTGTPNPPDPNYDLLCPDNLTPRVDPLHYYNSFGVEHAVIGGAFYTGTGYPQEWRPAGRNAFYFTDYPSGVITLLSTNSADGDPQITSFAGGFTGPVQIIQGPVDLNAPNGDKALYVVNIGSIAAPDGTIWRITYPSP